MSAAPVIELHDVSKWYGEVLGVNRVSLAIEPGITTIVGPNGCGKTTLMNLMTGLLRPCKGSVHVLGHRTADVELLHRHLGYCTSHDQFHETFTAGELLRSLLAVHGFSGARTRELADAALERVGLENARKKRIAAFSKGMRQRLKLAISIAHEPDILVLDEPLNGLDPLGRSEIINLLQALASEGATVVISSHVLHEVDLVSDNMVMLHHGYVVAEGPISAVRSEITDRPLQVLVRCNDPALLASRAFSETSVVSSKVSGDDLLVETTDTAGFSQLVARLAVDDELTVESLTMADESVQAVYDYLIGPKEVNA